VSSVANELQATSVYSSSPSDCRRANLQAASGSAEAEGGAALIGVCGEEEDAVEEDADAEAADEGRMDLATEPTACRICVVNTGSGTCCNATTTKSGGRTLDSNREVRRPVGSWPDTVKKM
jgi:hypothetical protein